MEAKSRRTWFDVLAAGSAGVSGERQGEGWLSGSPVHVASEQRVREQRGGDVPVVSDRAHRPAVESCRGHLFRHTHTKQFPKKTLFVFSKRSSSLEVQLKPILVSPPRHCCRKAENCCCKEQQSSSKPILPEASAQQQRPCGFPQNTQRGPLEDSTQPCALLPYQPHSSCVLCWLCC